MNIKSFLSILILILALSYSSQGIAQTANLEGTYSITKGLSANNFEYTGDVIIKNQGGNMYYLFWRIPNSEQYRGLGLLDHGILSVAYTSGPHCGFVIYKVEGGKLSGEWFTEKTEMESGYESLEGPPGLNGTYQIVDGESDDYGDKYSGTVEIQPFGEVYNLTWTIGDEVYTGVGLLHGDDLIVGWGADVGVMYYETKGNELLGRFAAAGANRTGMENLIKK
jgi:hypothetical protein